MRAVVGDVLAALPDDAAFFQSACAKGNRCNNNNSNNNNNNNNLILIMFIMIMIMIMIMIVTIINNSNICNYKKLERRRCSF